MTTATPAMPAATQEAVATPRRLVPAIGTPKLRMVIGLAAIVAAPFLAAAWRDLPRPSALSLVLVVLLAWMPAVLLTDKYRHKYPYRYLSYLLASHGKYATVFGLIFAALALLVGPVRAHWEVLAWGALLAALVDLIVVAPAKPEAHVKRATGGAAPVPPPPLIDMDARGAMAAIRSRLDSATIAMLESRLPQGTERGGAAVIDDREDLAGLSEAGLALLVGSRSVNAVRRLNLYLQDCTSRIAMGGYLVVRYTPLDRVLERMRAQHSGLRYRLAYLSHFIWYRALPKLPYLDVLYFSKPFRFLDKLFYRPARGRDRVLSRSEVWGRLAFYGFDVIGEEDVGSDGEMVVLARRTAHAITNRKPSYYAVVGLEKVGLDGDVIRLLKVRSMFPFSEFLQKKIFESHGLSATGKFKNDFRLTEYGPLIRRSWLDELPGIYNWLHGDVKLVGMRATSPHFLSLYPASLYDRYILVKPGLVPPIFDEKTAGFEQIAEIEETYLRRYLAAPVRTDIQYFWYTFRDIVFRRVRSH